VPCSPCGSGGIARMEELNENVVGAEGTEGSDCTSIEAAQQQRDLCKLLEFLFCHHSSLQDRLR